MRVARQVARGPGAVAPVARVTLDHAARLLRRRRLTCDDGSAVLVDLPSATGLEDGDRLICEDGAVIAVAAAAEPLWEVRGAGLARLAWHIGNRHAPCEIAGDALRIARDPVLGEMLRGLGAEVSEITAPFRPEGGAYGEGRVQGHGHGHAHPHPHHQGGGHAHG